MSENPTIREQIDACRPGSADLSLADMAELAAAVGRDSTVAKELQRSQRFDELIGEALQDVSIPAGLAGRILAASEAQHATPEVGLPAERTDERYGKRWLARRQWLLAGSAVSLAVLMVVVGYQFRARWARPVTQPELAGDVNTLLSELNSNSWRTGGLPGGVVMDPAILAKPRQWQPLVVPRTAAWSGSVTAIDLAGPGPPGAVLFVVKTSAKFSVPPTPTPAALLSLTGGYRATAWQSTSSSALYVLVIKEGRQRLDDFLRKIPEA